MKQSSRNTITFSKVLRWLLFCLLISFCPTLAQPGEIPKRPPGNSFIFDAADVLYDYDRKVIGEMQKEMFEQHQTPIVVVVVERMRDYGGDTSVETFARRWFDAWKIGAEGSNKGMLLLVSVGDRRARIELGADWGQAWNGEAQAVMDKRMVPRFRENDYPAGILAGMRGLVEMAKLGPESGPPGPGWGERVSGAVEDAAQLSMFEPKTMVLVVGAGLVLIVAGIFLPEARTWLVGLGVGLILLAFFTYVLLAVIAFLGGGRRGRGGFSSSGGFSGGFSGGGGASGSW